MKFENLSQIARYIVEDGKGILAADESNPTCKKDSTQFLLSLQKAIEEIIGNSYFPQREWKEILEELFYLMKPLDKF